MPKVENDPRTTLTDQLFLRRPLATFCGRSSVTAGADKTARVWNAASGQVIAKLDGHGRQCLKFAVKVFATVA